MSDFWKTGPSWGTSGASDEWKVREYRDKEKAWGSPDPHRNLNLTLSQQQEYDRQNGR